MRKASENYLLSYLNLLIHHLVKVEYEFGVYLHMKDEQVSEGEYRRKMAEEEYVP